MTNGAFTRCLDPLQPGATGSPSNGSPRVRPHALAFDDKERHQMAVNSNKQRRRFAV